MMTKNRKEMIERTIANRDYIDKMKAKQDKDGKNTAPYEITQLVNSFLLTLLHNWDEIRSDWPHLKQGSLQWPKIKSSKEKQQPQDCIRKIRDALAHGCFVFEGPDDGEIEKMHLWTCPPCRNCTNRQVDWDITLTTDDMRQMLNCFVTLAREQPLKPRARKKSGDRCP